MMNLTSTSRAMVLVIRTCRSWLSGRTLLTLLLLVVLTTSGTFAQTFDEVPQTGGFVAPSLPVDLDFGSDMPDIKDVDFGDLDGDGDLDIYVFASDDDGAGTHLDRVLINGNLTGLPGAFFAIPVADDLGNPLIPSSEFDSTEIGIGQRTYDGDLVDVDGDGDLDVIRTDVSGVYLLLNNGDATFEFRPDLMPTKNEIETGAGIASFDGIGGVGAIYFDGVDAADVDADGDPDAIIASYSAAENLYLINCWTLSGASRCPAAEGFAIGNVDGDVFDTLSADRTHGLAFGNVDVGVAPDLPDVFLTNTDSGVASRLLRNNGLSGDGTGRVEFVDATANMPVGGSNTRQTVDAEFADLDGDGDLDLFVVNRAQDNVLFWNDGSGTFTSLGAGLPALVGGLSSYDLAIADFDDDGDLDVMEAWGDGAGSALDNNRLLSNQDSGTDGSISFSVVATPFGPAPAHRLTISPGDFDGDVDVDVVGGNFDTNNVVLYENDLYDPADETFDLVATIDATGSMMATDGLANMRIDRAKNAAKVAFGGKSPDDRVALTEFATALDSAELIDLGVNPTQLVFDALVDTIVADGVATSAGAALDQSLETLLDPAFHIPFRRQALLIITDGLHNSAPLPQDIINSNHGGSWPDVTYNVISIANLVNPTFQSIVTHGSNFYASDTGLDLTELTIDAEADTTGKLVLDVVPVTGPAVVMSQRDRLDLRRLSMADSDPGAGVRFLLGWDSKLVPTRAAISGSTVGSRAPWTVDFAVPQSAVGMTITAENPTTARLQIFNNRMRLLGETVAKAGPTPTFIGLRTQLPNVVTAKLEYADGGIEMIQELAFSHGSMAFAGKGSNEVIEDHTFVVGQEDRQLRASLTWQRGESQPTLTLIDPDGLPVAPAGDPRTTETIGSVYHILKVSRPKPGTWIARELRPRDEQTFVGVVATSGPSGSTEPPLFDAEPALLRNFLSAPLIINASFNLSNPNLRVGAEPTVRALVEDPQGELSTVDGTDLGNGNFELVLAPPSLEGAYDVRITAAFVDGGDFQRTITRRFAAEVRAQVPSEICDANSGISVTPGVLTADGESGALVLADLIDCSGQPFQGEPEAVQFQTTAGELVGPVVSEGGGRYSRSLRAPTLPGVAQVSPSVDGRRIQTEASVELVVGDADADASTIAFTNSEGFLFAQEGATGIVVVTPRDALGNLIGDGATVDLTLLPTSSVDVSIDGPVFIGGQYVFTITLVGNPTPGDLFFNATVNGVVLNQTLQIPVVDFEQPGQVCATGPNTLCLNENRFEVEVTWSDFDGNNGPATDTGLVSPDSGLFYFFSPDNWELLVKVLDGCGINDRFWVFAAASTDVEYTLEVTDTRTGFARTYVNPLGVAAPAITDTAAFATCSAQAPAGAPAPVTAPSSPAPRERRAALAKQGACAPGAARLCLNGGRFAVEVDWVTGDGSGSGQVDAFQSADSGLFWFFSPNNLEMLVKVLDGCGINDRVWVFAAATTDVEYTLRVIDTETGDEKEYANAAGNAADAVTDTDAFAACPP